MGRGPSYPYVGLEEAISLARKVYDFAKRGPAVSDSLVTDAFKYSATSSSGQKVLAALRAFGLIEDAPGTNSKAVRLTPRSIRILLDDQDSQEREIEIKKAALSPKWYEYCWKKWGKDMPPAMKSNLLIEHGFVESTVEGFLKDYRKTVAFAGLLDHSIFGKEESQEENSTTTPNLGDYVQWESQGVLKMPAAKKLIKFSDDGRYAFVEGYFSGIPTDQLIAAEPPEMPSTEDQKPPAGSTIQVVRGGVKMLTDTMTLGDGITIQLQWPSTISQDTFDDFSEQLEFFKKRVHRAIQKSSTQEEPPTAEEK